MATRTISDTLRRPSGDAWPGAKVRFQLRTDLAVATAATMQQTVVEVTANASGVFSADLEVPDSGTWDYAAYMPDGQLVEFTFGAGAATTLREIIGAL